MNKPRGIKFKPSATALILGWVPLTFIAWVTTKDASGIAALIMGVVALTPLSIWWIHRTNAKRLNITGIRTSAFHEGQNGLVQVDVVNKNKHCIHNVSMSVLKNIIENRPETTLALPGSKTTRVDIGIPPGLLKRGRHPLDRATLHTGFPFHLFTTFQQADFDSSVVVYPEIEQRAPDWPISSEDKQKSRMGEDIVGMREYQHGDAMRSIDWKLSAKQNNLVVREYERPQHKSLMFSWEQVQDLGTELGLKRLTAWTVRAESHGRMYGLDLQGRVIHPGRGRGHLEKCLTDLALFRGGNVGAKTS